MKRAYADRVAELEARVETSDLFGPGSRPGHKGSPDTQFIMQQAITDSHAKLAQLKKAHSRLQEKYTDLELDYESAKSQLDALQGGNNGHSYFREASSADPYVYGAIGSTPERPGSGSMSGSGGLPAVDSAYDAYSEYQGPASDPTSRRFQAPPRGLVLPSPRSEITMHSAAGLTWRPPVSRADSMASRGSSQPPVTFNQTAPISEGSESNKASAFSDGSSQTSKEKPAAKIVPTSEVRVYGRGKSCAHF